MQASWKRWTVVGREIRADLDRRSRAISREIDRITDVVERAELLISASSSLEMGKV
jgi:hypothetical protein